MQKNPSTPFFLLLLSGAVLFIASSSRSLPPLVASHFNDAGVANGFMPRDFYVRFMLAFVTLLPLALAFLPARTLEKPGVRLNLPHRDYWLAPARRAATLMFLRRQMTRMAGLTVLFICYAHWLVVGANACNRLCCPPRASCPGSQASCSVSASGP